MRCCDCRNWENPQRPHLKRKTKNEKNYGECSILSRMVENTMIMGAPDKLIDIYVTSDPEDDYGPFHHCEPTLETHAEFGCILWEKKE